MTNKEKIGDRLRKARKEMGLSQEAAGRLLYPAASKASAESRWKRFEVNGQKPTIEQMEIISKQLKCSPRQHGKYKKSGKDRRGDQVDATRSRREFTCENNVIYPAIWDRRKTNLLNKSRY